jgi:hypothetical protein
LVHETGEDGLLVSHCVENMEQYVHLNNMDFAPNVRSISFSVDKIVTGNLLIRFGSNSARPLFNFIPNGKEE